MLGNTISIMVPHGSNYFVHINNFSTFDVSANLIFMFVQLSVHIGVTLNFAYRYEFTSRILRR